MRLCPGGFRESCYEFFQRSVSRRDRNWLLFPSLPERHSQSERDRTEDGVRIQRRSSQPRSLFSSACFRSARRRGESVRTSRWVATNKYRSSGRTDFIPWTHLHPQAQTTRTCRDVRSDHIPHRNVEPARCGVRRHSSQQQLRRGVAPRAASTVPVSPPDRMDFHERDSFLNIKMFCHCVFVIISLGPINCRAMKCHGTHRCSPSSLSPSLFPSN